MSQGLQPPRGTQDLLPEAAERFWAHERMGGDVFARAGYRRILTPMFEDTALFVRGVGEGTDIVNKEMYTFRDRSENQLTLRPEGTAPVMRAVITHAMWNDGLPIKVWYSAAMFRYDRPQKGRYRQHHQLGIEAIGSEDPAVDAEVIGVGKEMLDRAGVGELTLMLNSIGHPGCRADYLPTLVAFLERHRDELDEDCRRRMTTNPLRVFDCKVERDRVILTDAPQISDALCDECRAHFEAVQGYLTDAGVKYDLAPRLVRGLDYYTRTTFEFVTGLLEEREGTVCGGGRYDGLSELLGGPPLPGIGFGSGIERVLLAQDAAGTAVAAEPIACFVIPLEPAGTAVGVRLAAAIRAAGFGADLPYVERSLKTHLKHASRIGARTVALLGSKELERGVATMRDMGSGEQTEVALDAIPAWLEERTR